MLLAPLAQAGDTGMDPEATFAYGENTGWFNTRPSAEDQLTLHFDGTQGSLSGFVWGENIGWVHFPTNGYGGVEVNDIGELSGYAWGENVGWIHFPTNGKGGVAIDVASGTFYGHAWGENIGWIRFASVTHGVRTVAFDRQGQGTPNWWLDHHSVSEGDDAGDGVPAWRKYVMDVSPTNSGNGLVITSVTNDGTSRVTFTPASSRRVYTLMRSADLASSNAWADVAGQTRVTGSGSSQTLIDTNASPVSIYAIQVEDPLAP